MLHNEAFFSLTGGTEPDNTTPGSFCNTGGLATSRARFAEARIQVPMCAACA